MGIFSDTLEANRERSCGGYIDPCMIIDSLDIDNKRFADCYDELNEYDEADLDAAKKANLRQEFLQRSSELEKLKAGYLVAEKAVLRVINRGKLQSDYMKDMLDILQSQLRDAYRAICELRFEIDQKFKFEKALEFQPDREDDIRLDVLNKLMNTALYHMESGRFADTNTFRKVVSDCAEIIRCMRNEDYGTSDKSVFSYYLMVTMGLKETRHKCCNCGKPLLDHVAYCLHCYERNL